ncbi:MAG: toxin-activating lysine-acyltransferase [Paracoccaceae bacterium]|jgi:cytolysin-activating lysine-acyltransferase|nr:toxin-activating lysine-acyltransferase [Paracoccaceae bacterium]
MTTPKDSVGREIPPSEMPSEGRLRVYGDAFFLAMRSGRHLAMTTAELRTYLEPPILMANFQIFRASGVPRAMITWAHLNEEAEQRLLTGEPLRQQDWNSGQHRWVIDILAPYGGMMRGIGRWVMVPGNFSDREFYFRRVSANNETRRIVHVDMQAERKSRIMTGDEYLAEISD